MNSGVAGLPADAPRTERFRVLLGKLFFVIPIGVIGNVVYTVVTTDRAALASSLHFSVPYFIGCLLLSVVPWFTGSLRTFIWGRFLGRKLRYRDMVRISIGSELGAAVSPPFVGGGPVKVLMLMGQGFSGGAALSLVMLENFEDAVFFIVMVPAALTVSSAWGLPAIRNALAGAERLLLVVLVGAACALPAGLLLARRPAELAARLPFLDAALARIRTHCRQFIDTFRTIGGRGKKVFALTMALTTVQWICRYSIVSLVLMSLGLAPRPLLFMALQVVVFALLLLVPSPGGLGGAEALFSIIYGPFLPAHTTGLVTAGWRFFTFYVLLLIGAALFLVFNLSSGGRADAVRAAGGNTKERTRRETKHEYGTE